jgi:hypothetical protein
VITSFLKSYTSDSLPQFFNPAFRLASEKMGNPTEGDCRHNEKAEAPDGTSAFSAIHIETQKTPCYNEECSLTGFYNFRK